MGNDRLNKILRLITDSQIAVCVLTLNLKRFNLLSKQNDSLVEVPMWAQGVLRTRSAEVATTWGRLVTAAVLRSTSVPS